MSSRFLRVRLFAASIILVTTSAFAGEGNVLRVIQTSPDGATEGNSLFVDQSNANFSTVTGPALGLPAQILQQDSLDPNGVFPLARSGTNASFAATQTGSANSATVTMTGDGGELQLLQDGVGNRAEVIVAGRVANNNSALGAVIQIGDQNLATVDLSADSLGVVLQNGIGNTGTLEVGPGGTGQLVQNGNGSTYPVNVQAGTTVTVTQNGNGLQPVGVQGIQVFSTNPGTISITQTGF